MPATNLGGFMMIILIILLYVKFIIQIIRMITDRVIIIT